MAIVPLKVIVFVVASLGLGYLTRSSLRDVHSHGFPRFFAWEAILILILLNIEYWFQAPFSVHQIISWLFLVISAMLVISATRLLHSRGKPDSRRHDSSLIGIEKTTQLVTVGPYRYIRHPLYSSLLFLTWGTFSKRPSWFGMLLAVIATVLLTMTAKTEEAENKKFFGLVYDSYSKTTKMFIPFFF